jgi:hypothetical protein
MTREDFWNYMREIPVFGGLVDCDGHDHWESIGETTVLFILSSMPIWLGALIVYATSNKVGLVGWKLALFSTVANGELFMYSTAFLAPVFWIALKDRPSARVFPGKVSHIVLMVIISVIAAVFFGLHIAGSRLNERFALGLSIVMFFISLILLYLGILYHQSLTNDAATVMRENEESFSAEYRERRDAS